MRYLIETDTNESKSKSMIYKIPNEADFLFVYSSADGKLYVLCPLFFLNKISS